LAPALVNTNEPYPEQINDSGIFKRQLIVKDAWQMGPDNVDMVGIFPDDDPVVPSGVSDPPIHELLRLMKSKVRRPQREHPAAQDQRRKDRKRERQQKKKSQRK